MTIIGAPPQREAAHSATARLPLPRESRDSPPAPQRSPELAHLTLGRLRTYRQSLLVEEVRVSYWRRILQARRDLLRAGSPVGDHAFLCALLAGDRGHDGRRMILVLHPEGGLPILPNLPELWASLIDGDDDGTNAELFVKLGEAESILSSYREALHRRLNRATADLVARYHGEPRLSLTALPNRS